MGKIPGKLQKFVNNTVSLLRYGVVMGDDILDAFIKLNYKTRQVKQNEHFEFPLREY